MMLADQSKFCWGTVAEYVQNELAEESDDEKRIWKAESRAKMNRNKEKRNLDIETGGRNLTIGTPWKDLLFLKFLLGVSATM